MRLQQAFGDIQELTLQISGREWRKYCRIAYNSNKSVKGRKKKTGSVPGISHDVQGES